MAITFQNIPESLIYEIVDGKPIYYKGYKSYLSGERQLEEVMGSSTIQSSLVSKIVFLLQLHLQAQYLIFTNELGLLLSKKLRRAAGIAICDPKKIKTLDNKYLNIPPDIVIEVDTKADLSELKNPFNYYQEKTTELLEFGVKKVIWIFTDTQKVMIAEKDKSWEIVNWNQDIHVLENVQINIQSILDEIQKMID